MENDDKKDGVLVLTKNLQTGPEKALIHKTTIVANCPIWRPWLCRAGKVIKL